jgi:HSP20 family protein
MRELRKGWPLFVPEMPTVWRPLADIYRTRDGWLLKFDLAGVRLEDVTVSVRGRMISVSGCRKDTVIESGASYYSMEISYNRFERTIEMPTSLDAARMTLEARDGILMVRLVGEVKGTEGKHNAR